MIVPLSRTPLERLLLLVGLVAFVVVAVPVHASPTCGLCRRGIQGEYLVYSQPNGGKLSVCQACQRSARTCALCKIPHRETGTLCAQCQRTARSCDVCRQVLVGDYRDYRLPGGQPHRVCVSCVRGAATCHACSVPHAPNQLKNFPDGTSWCTDCARRARMCEGCRSPIQGTFFTVQFQPGHWCAGCFHTHEKCHFCGRPMDATGAHLPDGRQVCRACFSTSVEGQARVRQIAGKIRPLMQQILGKPLTPVPVRVVDTHELQRVYRGGTRPDGATNTSTAPQSVVSELGVFRIEGGVREILILDALPEDMAWETIAHEMAHAWQAEHYPDCTEFDLVEGFAQWVAEKVCDHMGRRSGLEKLRHRQDAYGRAYRIVAAIEQNHGVGGIHRALRQNRIPAEFRGIR